MVVRENIEFALVHGRAMRAPTICKFYIS